MSECEWVWAQCSTPATQKPRRSAHCATPATQKRRRPKGRQGVHPTPWQCTLSHACHAKEAETQGTPGRTSDPLAVHIVPRLPRKSGGDPRDARAYIRPLGSAHCPTPATQKRRRPKGRQGVHPTPWQCTLCHACHAKAAETQGTPGRTSDPLAVHIVPRLPRKRGGDPRDARAYIRPLGSAHCATPATQKRRRPKGRQGVHPTPWQCTLCHACHAKAAETQGTPGRTSNPLAVHIVPRLPRKSGGDPRDARAYIRPLGSAHCATPATQKRRRPKGRQGIHPTPWQCTLCHACHAKEAETQGTPGRTSDPLAVHIVPRLPRKRGGDPRDARAYIRPLGSAHCATPATQKRRRPRDASGTPGRTSDPLAVHIVPRLPRKSGGDPRDASGTPGRTSDPLAVHIVPRLPRKSGGDPRDASGTPGRTSDPLAVHIKSHACHAKAAETQGTPAEPRGVHPTPWQSTLCHACHAKEAETQGTPAEGRTSDPLAMHIVPRLPRKMHMSEWVSVWVSESEWVWVSVRWVSEWVWVWGEWVSVSVRWVSECVSECEWVSVCEWVREWVSVWVSVSECVSEWVSVSEWVWEWVSVCVWVSECEWVRVSECEWVSESEWVCVCVSEWVRVSECVCVSEWVWVSEWEWVSVSEWVRVSECVCVSEEGGREGGGGGRGADTELKTKTPHVNVGNNVIWTCLNHPPVISVLIAGMFTIPKWVVQMALFYPHDIDSSYIKLYIYTNIPDLVTY